MSQPTPPARPGPSINLRGAVDLAAVTAANKRREQAVSPPGRASAGTEAPPGPGLAGVVVDVSEATFNDTVIQTSMVVPVVVDLWAEWCEPCKQLSPVLERLAVEYRGRFLLAKVDVDANPRLGQAFKAQSIPLVVAVVKGQPVPLFNGAYPEAQIRQIIAELLEVAESNGVAGQLAVDGAGTGDEMPDDWEPPLPPLHQRAYDAIEAGHLQTAIEAYEEALRENPADADAKAGLCQVRLLARVERVDAVSARRAAADDPDDVSAQTLAADIDLHDGKVAAALDRLVDLVRRTAGEDRDAARSHLLELFEVVGPTDPLVTAARSALTRALF